MQVAIRRFKAIQDVSFDVNGLTLLVGGNNSGKSSVLQAIQFGVSVAQTSQMQGGFWNDGRLATSIGQGELVYSPIKDVLSLGQNGRLREDRTEAIEIQYSDGADTTTVAVRKGRNKNVVLEIIGQALGTPLQSIQQPYSTLVTGLAGIPSEEEFETNIVVRKAAAKGDSNSVFRNILLQLRGQAEKWARFTAQFNRVFPNYALEVSFNPEVDETIVCTFERNGTRFPIDSCGTGVLQAIQIFSYINLFEPKLLLLDEPDSHLHPNNQKQLARELIAASESGLNVVVSTHSKHLVEALIDNGRLVWMKAGAKQPEVEDYELKALLDVGALNAGERLGNPARIFLTEDKNQSVLQVLLESNGFDMEDCDIVSYSGCTQIATATALISHLRRSHPDAEFFIHRDRDFMSLEALNNYVEKFAAMNVRVFLPVGNDLESYFNSAEHVSQACGIPVEVANDVLQVAFEQRREDLIAKYVNTTIENMRRSGEQVNAGAIAAQAAVSLNGPGSPAVHGKLLMKGVRDQLQARGLNNALLSTSPALVRTELAALLQPVA